MRCRRELFAGAVLLALALPAAAEEASWAWHVVRPGDTLEGITQRYLGSPFRWRENWALNKDIKDPDFLLPGQRVRIMLPPQWPSDTALLDTVSRQVEEQPIPINWQDARAFDLLRRKDAVRTGGGSSANLRFADGTSVIVSEDSLLFLRAQHAVEPAPQPPPRGVEIVAGQAEVSKPAASVARATSAARGVAPPGGIEIVVGPAATKPVDADAALRARARRPQAGGAQVMLYEGHATVQAAGAAVDVPAGTGTVVGEQALLPAPELRMPPAGADLLVANPRFSWSPVPGAAAYTLELCADAECASLVHREARLAEPSWPSAQLPQQALYWRVTAVAPSGLDGFPSATRPLEISGSGVAEALPTGAIVAEGPQAMLGDTLILGPGAHLKLDGAGGAAAAAGSVAMSLDGAEMAADRWGSGWQNGAHVATAMVTAPTGLTANAKPLAFVADALPPALTFDAVKPEAMRTQGLDQGLDEAETPSHYSRGEPDTPAVWSSDGRRWIPLLPKGESKAEWTVDADLPTVFIEARQPLRLTGEREIALQKGDILKISVRDEHSAVRQLRLLVTRAEREGSLTVEATDLLGNTATSHWRVARAGG